MNSDILYVGNFSFPDVSAAGKRVFYNALAMQTLGYTVHLLGQSLEDLPTESIIQYEKNIYFYSFPRFNRLNFIAYFYWFINFIRTQGIKPIIIIRYGSPSISPFSFLLYLWTKFHRIPLIIDTVEWHTASHKSSWFNILKDCDEWLMMTLLNRLGQGMIAISTFLSSYYKNSFSNLIIIPPLVSRYVPTDKMFRTNIQIVYAGTPFRIGHIVKNKFRLKDRLDITVKVIATLQQEGEPISFHVYGVTREEYLIAFPSHEVMLRHSGNSILFHGKRSMKEIHQAIKDMDFSILLREKNRNSMSGFSTKVVESMSLGVPVITTNTSDLADYIKPGKNGFFVHIENEEILKKELRDILHLSHKEYMQMRDYLYRNQDFCYTKFIESFKNFLSSVVREEKK